jgi:type II secretory pathway component PulL
MASVNSVNFVRKQRVKVSQFQRFDRLFAQISTGVLVACVLLVLGLFGYWRVQTDSLAQVKVDQKTQQNIVSSSASNEAMYLLYTARLTALGTILEDRSSQERGLDFLSNLARPGISFEAIAYDDSEKQLSFRIRAEDVYSVERMLGALKEPRVATQVATINLTDIRRGDDARYMLDAIVKLEEVK